MPRNVQLEKASETIFKQFDVDGDGRLSFWEYRLVLTLLSIPERDAEVRVWVGTRVEQGWGARLRK